jgi:hypothetical protein
MSSIYPTVYWEEVEKKGEECQNADNPALGGKSQWQCINCRRLESTVNYYQILITVIYQSKTVTFQSRLSLYSRHHLSIKQSLSSHFDHPQ